MHNVSGILNDACISCSYDLPNVCQRTGKTAFNKYLKVNSSKVYIGIQVARMIMDSEELQMVA